MDIAYSIANVPIRLTHERWFHIVENHDEMAGYYDDVLAVIDDPEFILTDDGFVITAYFTGKLDRSRVTWKRQ